MSKWHSSHVRNPTLMHCTTSVVPHGWSFPWLQTPRRPCHSTGAQSLYISHVARGLLFSFLFGLAVILILSPSKQDPRCRRDEAREGVAYNVPNNPSLDSGINAALQMLADLGVRFPIFLLGRYNNGQTKKIQLPHGRKKSQRIWSPMQFPESPYSKGKKCPIWVLAPFFFLN